MGQVLSLITKKVMGIAEFRALTGQHTKCKAVTTLLPYAIWQDRDGQPKVLNTLLHAVGASRVSGFSWHHVDDFTHALLREATPRAIILVSPHIPWRWLVVKEGFIQLWVAAASTVQYTEEVPQRMLDTLSRIASEGELSRHITVGVLSLLTKWPSLPPVLLGGGSSYLYVIKAVRGLGDVEVLKSYLLLAWSEWDMRWGEGFKEICASIREDFSRVGMGHHRADLFQRLDQILGPPGRELEYLQQHNPALAKYEVREMKRWYGKLRDTLLKTNIKAIFRTSDPIVMFLCILTQEDIQRIS